MVGSKQAVSRHFAAPASTASNANALYRKAHIPFLHKRISVVRRAKKDAKDDEADLLRRENADLRQQLAQRLDALEIQQREAFLEAHGDLVISARSIGEDIPALGPLPEVFEDTADMETVSNPISVAPAAPEPEPEEKDGVLIEIERDNTLVFKFATVASSSISNSSQATSMAADGLGKSASTSTSKSTRTRQSKTVSPGASSFPSPPSSPSGGDGTITFTFDKEIDEEKAAIASTPSDEADTEDTVTAVTAAAAPPATAKSTAPRTRRTTTAASTPPKSTTAASGTSDGTATTATKKDPWAASRTAASKEAESHDPVDVLQGKEYWLYATVPPVPVAGALCVLYFNSEQSGALKGRPRIQLVAKCNNWEVDLDEGDGRVEMAPADGVPRGEGTYFWKCAFSIPKDAYELNFIFGDGEGSFDNNSSQNYCLQVEGPMTRDLWIDTAPERAEAVYLKKQEEERIAAEKANKEREEAALIHDAEIASNLIQEIKDSFTWWREAAATSSQDAPHGAPLWRMATTSTAAPGSTVVLQYNKRAGPLAPIPVPDDQHLVLKIGHNQWKDPVDLIMTRSQRKIVIGQGSEGAEEWWEASVSVPPYAVVMNFVVQYYEHFDNNNSADYRLALELPTSAVNQWADGLASVMLEEVTFARKAREAEHEEKERLKAEVRLTARTKAEDVRRRQMQHVLFTEPATLEAGTQVTLHYNPNNTILHGAERVYLRGGYNRWRHPKSFGPIEMTAPSSTGEHFAATLSIPKDAYSLDFVFSDAEEHGRWDNRGGLDYHLPVKGAVVTEPPLYIAHIAVEMAPICKVGGLGDVVTALGRAVQEQGHQVEVILPRYNFFLQSPLLGDTKYETEFDWAGVRIFVSTCIVEGLRCWFIEPANGMFATSTVYQGNSDADRFAFFSRAALEFLLRTHRQPDIVHCHDWSTADVAKAYWTEYHSYGLWKPNVVFTIHNLNYGAAAIGEAAYYSQRFTTVSPTYAWEIGGHPAIAANNGKLMGIRNGIDIDIWNPETDQFLPMGYSADTCMEGKAAARAALRSRLGLTGWGDKPLVGVVTRLTKQKGTHLIAHSCWRTVERGGQFVLLGSAPDPKVQAEFDGLAAAHGGENAAFCFAFDEPLSHLIYAACDLILVPSMFEPCGLTQMIAMRYGAVPVVRATGGLKDTVFDVDTDKARAAWELEGSTNWVVDDVDATNGFAFEGTDPGALDYALNRAIDAYYNDPEWFRGLQERVMRQDWSWNKPAIDYIQLYYAALK